MVCRSYPDCTAATPAREWETLVDMLARADHMVRTDAISPVEHEAIWWQAYDRLAATTTV